MPNILQKIIGTFTSKNQEDIEQDNDLEKVEDIEDTMWQDELVTFVDDEFERRRQERMPFELQWRLNMDFNNGQQYSTINNYAQTLDIQEKMFDWQQREVYNHIAPITETRLAKLARVRPSMTVLPATNDTTDINNVKVCKAILKATYRKQKMQEKIITANSWAEICGCVWYKDTWDKDAGKVVAIIQDEDGTQEPLHEGDACTTVIPAFELYPDNSYKEPNNIGSLIHGKAYTVEEIKDIYNLTVVGSDVDVYSMGMTSLGTGGLGYTAVTPFVTPTVLHEAALVKEYYERPTHKYPKGRLIITAGSKLAFYGQLPYKNGEDETREIPFRRQNCVNRAGCFWGTSVIERCIPIQRSYNAVKNRTHEFLNRCAIGVLTYEEDSLDNVEDLEEEGIGPGTLLPRKKGSPAPSYLQNGLLPPELKQEEASLENAFILVSGISELSRSGATTGSGTSGVALEIIKEQDDTRVSLTGDNIKNACIDINKDWLRLFKQFVTGPRMDRLVGTGNEVLAEIWTTTQLCSDDVISETEDVLSSTPAQKKSQVYDMLKAGLANDPTTGQMNNVTRNKVLGMLDMGNWESLDNLDELHTNRAMKENLKVQKDETITVEEFDNHQIHIDEHNRFRLSSDYVTLREERPDLSQLLDAHVQMHQQALQQMAQQAQMQQAQMQQAMQPQQSGPGQGTGQGQQGAPGQGQPGPGPVNQAGPQ